MKRTNQLVLSLMLGGAATAASFQAHAQSSVVLYGMADDGIVWINNQNGHSNTYMRDGNLYASKFGLRGKEYISSTTTAIFDLQAGFNLNNGSNASSGLLFNREAFAGLADTRYGTLTAGRQYTPYYLFVGPMSGSNIITGGNGTQPGDIDGLDTTTRINSSVTYTSPVWNGADASVMFAPGGNGGSVMQGSTMSAALKYANGPLTLATGYNRMNNAGTTTGWDTHSTASFNQSVLDQGYLSARELQQFTVAASYQIGHWLAGVHYSNVEYFSGNKSLFGDTAVFNVYNALTRYQFSKRFDVSGSLAYVVASRANGVKDAARYTQTALRETYYFSPRTMVYFLQSYQHATGQTLNASGQIITAGPAIGDSQNLTPSSTHNQFLMMLGMAVVF